MEHDKSERSSNDSPQPDRIPLRRWEIVVFGLGVLTTAGVILVPVVGLASYNVFAGDCRSYDLGCELDELGWLLFGMLLGAVSAGAIAFMVIRRWRHRPPLRTVAWLVAVVLPVIVVLAANRVWG